MAIVSEIRTRCGAWVRMDDGLSVQEGTEEYRRRAEECRRIAHRILIRSAEGEGARRVDQKLNFHECTD